MLKLFMQTVNGPRGVKFACEIVEDQQYRGDIDTAVLRCGAHSCS